MAPRPPAAAKRFTLRSALRTPEQNPYFSARLTRIRCVERLPAPKDSSGLSVYNRSFHGQARATADPPLRRSVGVRLRHVLLRISTAPGDPFPHSRSGRIEGRGGLVPLRLHVR